MARKNLLKSLMETSAKPTEDSEDAPSPTPQAAWPRYTKGAIGAVSQSIADLKSRAIAEIDPFSIEQGGVVDRLDDEDADHDALVTSIRDHGQQVPVLLRPHPEAEGRYQIVFGRRRVKALRDLGMPVKAMVRDLDDRDLVIAQGQENTARKDLTFIEKANFARQMREAGYDRKVICDALHVDKTQVSRMLSVADAVPLPLIEAIGAAPTVGRDRWLRLALVMAETETDSGAAISMINLANASNSDERFAALMHALTLPRRRARGLAQVATARVLRSDAGVEVGCVETRKGKITVTIPVENAEGFDSWIIDNFARLHRDWLADREEKEG